jgi:nucleotide-binding universal stress UspA family protein
MWPDQGRPHWEVMAMNRHAAGRVVVGVHHSLGAYQALRHAVAEAGRRDATLLVVHALRRPAGRSLPPPEVAADAVRQHVGAVFVEALGAVPAGLRIEIVAEHGNPGQALVTVAYRVADVVVIGGSARRWLPLRGAPVASYCAAHAVCPVVIVPPPELARTGRRGRLARAAVRDAEAHLARTTRPAHVNPGWVRRRLPWAA